MFVKKRIELPPWVLNRPDTIKLHFQWERGAQALVIYRVQMFVNAGVGMPPPAQPGFGMPGFGMGQQPGYMPPPQQGYMPQPQPGFGMGQQPGYMAPVAQITCPKCFGKGGLGAFGPCEMNDIHFKRPCPCCEGRRMLPQGAILEGPCPHCQGKGGMGTFGPCEPHEIHFKSACHHCRGRGFLIRNY